MFSVQKSSEGKMMLFAALSGGVSLFGIAYPV